MFVVIVPLMSSTSKKWLLVPFLSPLLHKYTAIGSMVFTNAEVEPILDVQWK